MVEAPTPKKILLLGVMPGLTRDGVEEMRKEVAGDFPDHVIRIVPGLIYSAEFTVPDEISKIRPNAAYL